MKEVISVKRYIDDGAGFFSGDDQSFSEWISAVNSKLAVHGLNVDEYQFKITGRYVPFLDIQYCFDELGNLQTDLFIKPADSRSYLHFSSAHPNHIYSGIVYSQCLRLRRIINSQDRLVSRINDLKQAFIDANYPVTMITIISNKVVNSERCLDRKPSQEDCKQPTLPIRVVSTFGSDSDLLSTVKKYESHLTRTRSFSESDNNTNSSAAAKHKKIFQYVKKKRGAVYVTG